MPNNNSNGVSVHVLWPAKGGRYMKNVKVEELRPEYGREELGQGVRGKYLEVE